jgi:hypothetical protein
VLIVTILSLLLDLGSSQMHTYACNILAIFWEPIQNHHFSHGMYMHIYAVYERINQRYMYSENIYVGSE